jgi:hypothetical protein
MPVPTCPTPPATKPALEAGAQVSRKPLVPHQVSFSSTVRFRRDLGIVHRRSFRALRACCGFGASLAKLNSRLSASHRRETAGAPWAPNARLSPRPSSGCGAGSNNPLLCARSRSRRCAEPPSVSGPMQPARSGTSTGHQLDGWPRSVAWATARRSRRRPAPLRARRPGHRIEGLADFDETTAQTGFVAAGTVVGARQSGGVSQSQHHAACARARRTRAFRGCTGSDVRSCSAFPLADNSKLLADLETFWRRRKGSRLLAEILGGNWRGVRDSKACSDAIGSTADHSAPNVTADAAGGPDWFVAHDQRGPLLSVDVGSFVDAAFEAEAWALDARFARAEGAT